MTPFLCTLSEAKPGRTLNYGVCACLQKVIEGSLRWLKVAYTPALRECRPFKEAPKASTRKSAAKSALESAGPRRGAEESAEKCFGVPSPVLFSTVVRGSEVLFRHFPRHPVWGWHFPKHPFRKLFLAGALALL